MGRRAVNRGDELIFPEDVAIALKVHVRTVRRWIREGKLAAVKTPSGRIRIRRSDLEPFKTPEPVNEATA